MKEKEIAQRILTMYHLQNSAEEKREFLKLLKDIIKIIETMQTEDFVRFVDDFEKHLDELDIIKKMYGIDL
jgi:Asp-tRNA(Asn)/Glu-tRNA(Gln) amidotransferase C subunit